MSTARSSKPHFPRPASRRAPFSAASLARDFGAEAPLCRRAVVVLLAALGDGHGALAMQSWRERYGAVCGYDLDDVSPRGPQRALTEALGQDLGGAADSDQPGPVAALLFAVHSYFALLLQVLSVEVLAGARGVPSPLMGLSEEGEAEAVRGLLEDLAAGRLLRWLGVEDQDGLSGMFGWYARALTPAVIGLCRDMVGVLRKYDPASQDVPAELDLFKGLYQALFPRRIRHRLGEYYTPDWLAEYVLDKLGYEGDPSRRLLDPACGSGTFLVAALRRARRYGAGQDGLGRNLLNNIVGFDLNPLAVMAARVNYLIAIRDLPGLFDGPPLRLPVYLCDSILFPSQSAAHPCAPSWAALEPLVKRAAQPPVLPPFDYIAGNPPWVLWDHLPQAYRVATRPLWEHFGLFSLSGKDARHGGGKKDLAALMLYACADAYLKDGGRLGFVITQTLFQTRGAGDGFRRFRIGADGPYLKILRVDDLVALRPFLGANNWTSTVVLQKGMPTVYPVPYHRFTKGEDAPQEETLLATPAVPGDLRSPWLLQPVGLARGDELLALVGRKGSSEYHAHAGAYSGGQNGVYWVQVLGPGSHAGTVRVRNLAEVSKGGCAAVEHDLEHDLLYPLLRWIDVQPFRAIPNVHLLLVQDVDKRRGIPEAVLAEYYPRTLDYLRGFQTLLRQRAAFRRYFRPGSTAPFYTMYDIGRYTVAPWKVVWRRMDRCLGAAVVGPVSLGELPVRSVVPQETCVLIALQSEDEAHYLCALLNSAVLGYLLQGQSIRGGKSFGTPGMLAQVNLPSYQVQNENHRLLADLSRQAHSMRIKERELFKASAGVHDSTYPWQTIHSQIDEQAGTLYNIKPQTLREMQSAILRAKPP